jgi:Phospholipase_D-nuclease N-terminal
MSVAPGTPAPAPPHRRRSLRDLSTSQKAALAAGAAAQNALLVAALIDLRRRPRRQIRGDKRWWTAGVFVSWIGPISYFTYGRKR